MMSVVGLERLFFPVRWLKVIVLTLLGAITIAIMISAVVAIATIVVTAVAAVAIAVGLARASKRTSFEAAGLASAVPVAMGRAFLVASLLFELRDSAILHVGGVVLAEGGAHAGRIFVDLVVGLGVLFLVGLRVGQEDAFRKSIGRRAFELRPKDARVEEGHHRRATTEAGLGSHLHRLLCPMEESDDSVAEVFHPGNLF